MKTSYKPFARKFRQFNNQAKKIKRLCSEGKFGTLSQDRQRKMIGKLKKMYAELRGRLQHWRLRKTLVGLSFLLLGAGNFTQANAQVFDVPQLSPFGLLTPDGYNFVGMADIDDDGDADLFMSDLYDGSSTFTFSENIGTPSAPNFAAPVTNPFGAQVTGYAINPVLTDIDNDGDFDLFLGKLNPSGNAEITYFENTGTPTSPAFGPEQQNPFGINNLEQFAFPELADLDGDGDQDIIVTGYYSVVSYLENSGTPETPVFGSPTAAPFGITGTSGNITFMDFADLDGDGDLDLMAGTTYDNDTYLSSFFYTENTGSPTAPSFDETIQDPFGLVPFESYLSQPAFADIDDDGDLDLFSSAPYYGVAVFENLGAAPTSEDAMVETFISTPYTFAMSDFPYSDQDGDDFKKLKITGLTSVGTLQLNGVDVVSDQIMDNTDIPALVFTPIDDEEGDPYDTFTFQVGDDNDVFSIDHTMTVSVGGVSTKDNLLNASLDVFPNPTTDFIQLSLESITTLNDIRIRLIDKSGRTLTDESTTIAGNDWQKQFDLSEIAAGAYFIQIDADGKTVSTQFVKE